MTFHRWMYRGGRPNLLAKAMNRGWAFLHTLGIAPGRYVTLEVVGRKSGKLISFPLVMAAVDGKRYLVSMLGEEANWVQNIKASGGKATLRHGISEQVVLKEIEGNQKAPILKAYLQIAPARVRIYQSAEMRPSRSSRKSWHSTRYSASTPSSCGPRPRRE